MKASSGLFIFILIIWMGGSTYWYVCKIKNHCNETSKVITEQLNSPDKIEQEDLPETDTLDKRSNEKKIEDLKKDILSGYIVYNFPENSIEKENIEASFDEFTNNLKIYLEENKSEKIEIIGHTDDVGSKSANVKFGMKRALFIKKMLEKKGIEENRMVLSSKGKKEPISSNDTEEGRKKNRRVVIKLIKN